MYAIRAFFRYFLSGKLKKDIVYQILWKINGKDIDIDDIVDNHRKKMEDIID